MPVKPLVVNRQTVQLWNREMGWLLCTASRVLIDGWNAENTKFTFEICRWHEHLFPYCSPSPQSCLWLWQLCPWQRAISSWNWLSWRPTLNRTSSSVVNRIVCRKTNRQTDRQTGEKVIVLHCEVLWTKIVWQTDLSTVWGSVQNSSTGSEETTR